MGLFIFMTILFIDGENFRKKINDIFFKNKESDPELAIYDFRGLFDSVLEGFNIDKVIFYFARLKEHPQTREKSKQLIEKRRLLKNNLEKQGFEVILSGRVRGFPGEDGKPKFKEKGVDVKIAVDMLSKAYDGSLNKAIIASSDSDLQPAIRELKKRNVELIYLGFEAWPNKGLMYTTDRSILIREAEVFKFTGKTLL